ncbi:MAG: enoyl-CoA hydratase-related protein [Steroidobacteraceae bacterium]|jgi:enoyl-CoA hydratase/carnithine racemase|nr:enoyl-CoA hydratase-related protein [Steroidobacteraceae bacterium]
MSEFETLLLERRPSVDVLTLNRPAALNALTPTMVAELTRYFVALETSPAVRVVVLRGAGRAFCAGLDLHDIAARLPSLDEAALYAEQRALSRMILAMRRCPQPIVCLLQGAAAGGGLALALASDIRLCTPDTRLSAAFIRVGLSGCDVGVSWLLPRMVGASVAAELMMTGRHLGAERAERLGLVSEVCAPDALAARAEALIADLLATNPRGLALTKHGLTANLGAASLEAAVELEDRQQAMLAGTAEFRARVAAFAATRGKG